MKNIKSYLSGIALIIILFILVLTFSTIRFVSVKDHEIKALKVERDSLINVLNRY